MSVDFHFLNVGHGDCTIIHFPSRTCGDRALEERIMMVDIYHDDEADDHGSEDVIEYYKDHFRNSDGTYKPIFRFVCTHPHQDHICGLDTLLNDNDIRICNFWDIEHSFKPTDFSGHPTHEDDWNAYQTLRGTDSPATVIRSKREDARTVYWNASEDDITILSPSKELIHYAHYKEDGTKRGSDEVEIDEMSFALLIMVNSRGVVLAGDGRSSPCWNDIYANCKELLPKCWVLKAGHHGQESSIHEDAIRQMNPVLITLSNSKEDDQDNGAAKEYKRICPKTTIYKTCDSGTIVVRVPFDKQQPIVVN